MDPSASERMCVSLEREMFAVGSKENEMLDYEAGAGI